jgi:hypothetical protein
VAQRVASWAGHGLGGDRREKARRSVLFSDQGKPRVTHEVDDVHDGLG